jgi:hypothetical protein
MPSYSSDRRSVLKILGAIGATCSYPFAGDELFAQETRPAHHIAHSANPATRLFNDRDFATISRVTELIIPETDTPGAIAAGVPAYIDQAASRNADFQLLISDGLRWLDTEAAQKGAGKSFLELSESEQVSLLQPLCETYDAGNGRYIRSIQFFSLIKNLTADGYYTSQIGLVQELGYQNEMRMQYPVCTTEP